MCFNTMQFKPFIKWKMLQNSKLQFKLHFETKFLNYPRMATYKDKCN